jgi:hypothetical protein
VLKRFSGKPPFTFIRQSCSLTCSELAHHLRELEPYLGSDDFRPGMGLREKMKVVLKQAGEVLASELVAKTLTGVNRKIASSLQVFVVRFRVLFGWKMS